MALAGSRAGDGTSVNSYLDSRLILSRVFILEGLLTVILGVASPFCLPDDPDSCKFLTEAEKKIVTHRLQMDTGTVYGSNNLDESFKWKHVWSAFRDWKVWTVVVIYWGSAIPIYGLVLPP